MPRNIGRRESLKCLTTGLAAGASAGCSQPAENGTAAGRAAEPHGYNIYFGDMHNHNMIGYGLGTPRRAFEIAQSHLDFYTATPHAYGDYDVTDNMAEDVLAGRMRRDYIKTTYTHYPDILALVREFHTPGEFVTFPGYERHSSEYGDYTVMFSHDNPELVYFAGLDDFQKHVFAEGGFTWQHHPAYPAGSSGARPEFWDSRIPILEIFSEHGNAESGTAPKDYIRHSGRGRVSSQTMQAFLADGYRFGVVGSTDNHLGFPGAWGQGKAAVLAEELTRGAIFEAIMNRRVYGVSGDKIKLDFRVNGVLMGGETPHTTGKRHIYASVEGRDWVGCVELLKNNTVIYRDFPVDKNAGESVWNKPLILRMQYGWAGMAANQVPQDKIHPVYDWDITCSAGNTNIAAVEPYWQEGPFDENRRHILSDVTANGFRLKSYHSRRRAFEQRDTHEIALIIDSASPRDSITLSFAKPDKTEAVVKLGALMEHDHNIKLNGGSCKLRRLVPSVNANTAFTVEDTSDGASDDWYYIRVFQKNGQMAWSSPVWVNGA